MRGLARTRLKRLAIRTNVNDGFNEFDRPVTLRNLDLSGPDHTDGYAQFSAFRNHGTRRGRLNSRVSCRGVVTPEIFLGFRSPVIFGQGSAPVAGCRDPSRFRPRQRFSPQALPSLLARLHLGHRSWQPSSVLRMRVQGSPGRFIPDFGSYNDRGICCVDTGFPNRC